MKRQMIATAVLTLCSISTYADQVINSDLIIQGSACVGAPCMVDDDFGFDTLQLKSETPSILFRDTSNSASFPTTDWLLSVSDSINNVSIFKIDNVDDGTSVLQLSASVSGGAAIGAGSVLVDGAVSFGSDEVLRRVSYVAQGTEPTDAVTLEQLEALEDSIPTELSELESQLNALANRVDEVVVRLDNL